MAEYTETEYALGNLAGPVSHFEIPGRYGGATALVAGLRADELRYSEPVPSSWETEGPGPEASWGLQDSFDGLHWAWIQTTEVPSGQFRLSFGWEEIAHHRLSCPVADRLRLCIELIGSGSRHEALVKRSEFVGVTLHLGVRWP